MGLTSVSARRRLVAVLRQGLAEPDRIPRVGLRPVPEVGPLTPYLGHRVARECEEGLVREDDGLADNGGWSRPSACGWRAPPRRRSRPAPLTPQSGPRPRSGQACPACSARTRCPKALNRSPSLRSPAALIMAGWSADLFYAGQRTKASVGRVRQASLLKQSQTFAPSGGSVTWRPWSIYKARVAGTSAFEQAPAAPGDGAGRRPDLEVLRRLCLPSNSGPRV